MFNSHSAASAISRRTAAARAAARTEVLNQMARDRTEMRRELRRRNAVVGTVSPPALPWLAGAAQPTAGAAELPPPFR